MEKRIAPNSPRATLAKNTASTPDRSHKSASQTKRSLCTARRHISSASGTSMPKVRKAGSETIHASSPPQSDSGTIGVQLTQ
ncbi:MAG: hypothetical protein ACLRM8_01255 [Alistipes sp.]